MQIEEKKAMVSLQQIPDAFEINGDRQHLTNVFRNLIDNALKYSEHLPRFSPRFLLECLANSGCQELFEGLATS